MRYIIALAAATLLHATSAHAEVPRVVTDIPPVHSLVAQVMGDLGAPVLLLESGANAHGFQLRPSQAADLQSADLVVWIGPAMTPWLDRALKGVEANGVDLRLLDAPGTLLRAFGAEAVGHEHGEVGHGDAEVAEHGEAERMADGSEQHGPDAHGAAEHGAAEHGAAEHGHAAGGTDPHAWLDPANARYWAGLIGAELGRIDPENAATYAANAASAQAAITAMDAEIAERIAPARDKPIVVFHDAYGYFADHYGLTVIGAVAEGDAATPGAQHLRALQAALSQGPACIFPEANHDPAQVNLLAQDQGVRVGAPLDPEGAAQVPGPALYDALMRGMAEAIADCAAG